MATIISALVSARRFPRTCNLSTFADILAQTGNYSVISEALSQCSFGVSEANYLRDLLHTKFDEDRNYFSDQPPLWESRPSNPVVIACCSEGALDNVVSTTRQITELGQHVIVVDASKDGLHKYGEAFSNSQLTTIIDRWTLDQVVEEFSPRAIVMQLPYIEFYNDSWQKVEYRHRLAYVGYGLTLSNWTYGQYQSPFFRRFAYLGANQSHDVDHFLAAGCIKRSLRWIGNPVLWELRERQHNSPLLSNQKSDFSVLWAPHWSMEWFGSRGYSTFQETLEDMIAAIESANELRIIVRPHPLLWQWLDDEAPQPLREKFSDFLSGDQVRRSDGLLVDDLFDCDACVTDGVAIIGYAAAIGKPLCITRREDSPKFSVDGEAIVRRATTSRGSASLRAWLYAVQYSGVQRIESLEKELWLRFPCCDTSPGSLLSQWTLSAGKAV